MPARLGSNATPHEVAVSEHRYEGHGGERRGVIFNTAAGRLEAGIEGKRMVADFLSVTPNERRKGHASALVNRAIDYAREHDLSITLRTPPTFDQRGLYAALHRRGADLPENPNDLLNDW